jgi:hypothetical protein
VSVSATGPDTPADMMQLARDARLLRALDSSRRRLVRTDAGWAVVDGSQSKRMMDATREEGERLLERGWIEAATAGGGYVLSGAGRDAERPVLMNWAPGAGASVFLSAGRPRARDGGAGFPGLAHRAQMGEGPLSLRQAQAGLRLIADVERSGADPSLSMNWNAVASSRMRRSGERGGAWIAMEARRMLARVEATAGKDAFALAKAACVDGLSLRALGARFGLARGDVGEALSVALEKVADAYDGGGS